MSTTMAKLNRDDIRPNQSQSDRRNEEGRGRSRNAPSALLLLLLLLLTPPPNLGFRHMLQESA
jgi:hypothetical protein